MACFSVFGAFWGVFGIFGAQNQHFSSFFGVASLLREGVEVLGITPHLLNVSDQTEARFGADSLERLVLHLHFPRSAWQYGHAVMLLGKSFGIPNCASVLP